MNQPTTRVVATATRFMQVRQGEILITTPERAHALKEFGFVAESPPVMTPEDRMIRPKKK